MEQLIPCAADESVEMLQIVAGASAVRNVDGVIDIRTPASPWAYGVLVRLGTAEPVTGEPVGLRVGVDVQVQSGTAGLFLTDRAALRPLGREMSVGESDGRTTLQFDCSNLGAERLCIRSGDAGSVHLRLHGLQVWVRSRFDITDIVDVVLPVLLKTPGKRALETVAEALAPRLGRVVDVNEIGALECRCAPLAMPSDAIWNDPVGRLAVEEANRLIQLLPSYDSSKVESRAGFLGPDYFKVLFKQSIIRVYHLVSQLRELGMMSGTILEIGSLCGQFALCLQRLGYRVTAVDRYRAYRGAFAGYAARMRETGVDVVETDRNDELQVIARLGRFDAVIAMAVIEHIPHTPREFVQMLASHTQPGGVLALDTPNIARYWNRRRLADGLSIHQALEDQFYADIPYEGHHREYTRSEMAWILEQVGCRDVRTTLFDINPFQFDALSVEHIDALLTTTIDPTQADIVLVAGRRGTGQP